MKCLIERVSQYGRYYQQPIKEAIPYEVIVDEGKLTCWAVEVNNFSDLLRIVSTYGKVIVEYGNHLVHNIVNYDSQEGWLYDGSTITKFVLITIYDGYVE